MTENTSIHSVPENSYQYPRRQMLKLMAGAGTVALGSSTWELSAIDQESESFWQMTKAQFSLRPGLMLMNAANLCPAPYPVSEMVYKLTRDIDADASFQNRQKFSELTEKSRHALAGFLGAAPEEIVLTRNTTEGNNTVLSGLDLGPGDEVVVWDQNHPTNNVGWDVRAQRFGFTVKRVTTPVAFSSPQELIAPFKKALTGKTKVLAMTHASNISGVALPVRDLCHLAREREILTLIDGAQSFGSLQVNLHQIGCDFYAGSAHKWFLGPKESGVLFVRKERIAQLWPALVGSGWDGSVDDHAHKFESMGQRDDATLAAVGRTVSFHQEIGRERVERRVRALAGTLKRGLQKIPGVVLHTPVEDDFSAGVVVFSIGDLDPRLAFEHLHRKYQIGGAGLTGMFSGVRLCPHIYNPMSEIQKAISAVGDLAKNGLA